MGKVTFEDKEQAVTNQQPEKKKFTHENANEMKNAINTNFHDGDDWDNSQNKFPDVGGTGTDGAIRKLDRFISFNNGSWEVVAGQGAQDVYAGAIFIALTNNPGQTPANWRMI